MIILHAEVATFVVERLATVDVVRRIDVQAPLEHVRRRVGGVDVGHQRLRNGVCGELRKTGLLAWPSSPAWRSIMVVILALRGSVGGTATQVEVLLDAGLGALVDPVEEQQRHGEQERKGAVDAYGQADACTTPSGCCASPAW